MKKGKTPSDQLGARYKMTDLILAHNSRLSAVKIMFWWLWFTGYKYLERYLFLDSVVLLTPAYIYATLASSMATSGEFVWVQIIGYLYMKTSPIIDAKNDISYQRYIAELVQTFYRLVSLKTPSIIHLETLSRRKTEQSPVRIEANKAEALIKLSKDLKRQRIPELTELATTAEHFALQSAEKAKHLLAVTKNKVHARLSSFKFRTFLKRIIQLSAEQRFICYLKTLLKALGYGTLQARSYPPPGDLSLLRIPTTKPNAPAYP